MISISETLHTVMSKKMWIGYKKRNRGGGVYLPVHPPPRLHRSSSGVAESTGILYHRIPYLVLPVYIFRQDIEGPTSGMPMCGLGIAGNRPSGSWIL